MYVILRNPDYVEEPLVFKPERWSRDGSTPKLDPFIYQYTVGLSPGVGYGRSGINVLPTLEGGVMEVCFACFIVGGRVS